MKLVAHEVAFFRGLNLWCMKYEKKTNIVFIIMIRLKSTFRYGEKRLVLKIGHLLLIETLLTSTLNRNNHFPKTSTRNRSSTLS